MKSIHKIILAAAVIIAVPSAAGAFTDLPESHPAYNAVQTLVAEGTVADAPDGAFRPDDPVTRAELVKMVGYRLSEPRNDYIVDLRRLHWAYDNLRYSPLRTAEGRKLLPDAPVTREEAAVYIYDCYANGEDSYAPAAVLADTLYPTEVGWVYEHGIMTGDGINLGLGETLTRAEAAQLAVKAHSPALTDFADNIPEDKLARIFNSSGLFDVTYERGAVLTNGQIARAAYRLRLDTINALWYNENADFKHQYANDLKAMEFVLGAGRISAEFADAPAAPEDALAMLAYGMAHKIHASAPYGMRDKSFIDAKPASEAEIAPLTFAWKNGLRPYAGGVLHSGTPVTHRFVASLLLQCDVMWGLGTSVTTDGEIVTYNDESMRLDDLPENEDIWQQIPASVPPEVYQYQFYGGEPSFPPKVNYPMENDIRDAFIRAINTRIEYYVGRGVALKITYYPQLVYGSFVVRCKVEFKPEKTELFKRIFTDPIVYMPKDGEAWVDFPLTETFFLGGNEDGIASISI